MWTLRVLGVMIGEHIAIIKKGFRGHNLYKHDSLFDNKDPSSLHLVGIDTFSPQWRELMPGV